MADNFSFTRLSLTCGDVSADIVVASDQPLGGLMPRLLDLVGKPADGSSKYDLVLSSGDMLNLNHSCLDNNLAEGESVYLIEREEVPAPPVISNVTDVVARARDTIPRGWGSTLKYVVGSVSLGSFVLLASVRFPWTTGSYVLQTIVLASFTIAILVSGIFCAKANKFWAATSLCSINIGLAWSTSDAIVHSFTNFNGSQLTLTKVCVSALLIWLTLGLVIGLGMLYRPALISFGIGGTTSLLAVVLAFCDVPDVLVAAVVGVISVIILGLLPTWVIAASGLTGVDDSVKTGKHVGASRVVSSLKDAYRTLGWCITCITIMAAISTVPLSNSGTLWGVWLSLIIILILLLRTRSMPSRFQIAVCWFAALASFICLLFTLNFLEQSILAVAVCAVLVTLMSIKLPRPLKLRLRSIGDVIEKLAIVASVPILLGLWGIYVHLLGTKL